MCRLTSIGNPIVEIRRSQDRLISTMGFPILVRQHLYIELGPWCRFQSTSLRTANHLVSGGCYVVTTFDVTNGKTLLDFKEGQNITWYIYSCSYLSVYCCCLNVNIELRSVKWQLKHIFPVTEKEVSKVISWRWCVCAAWRSWTPWLPGTARASL